MSLGILDLLGGRGIPAREALGIVEWAEAFHRLSARSSSNPGPWRVRRLPYLREPLECFTNPGVRRITLLFASQCGKSTAMEVMLGYAADRMSYPAIWCFPGEKSKDAWAEERLKPTVDASPRWQQLLSPGKRSMTRAGVSFHSMPLFYALADSEADLASKSVGFVFADEIDKFPESTAREGSPLGQLRMRMRTFPFGKFVQSSTPTKVEGPIWQEYQESDRREWWVACEGCGHAGPWQWEAVRWDKIESGTGVSKYRKTADGIRRGELGVWYECPSCGHRHVGDAAKDRMNEAGQWVGRMNTIDHVGFHLPSMASPFTKWRQLAVDWLIALEARERGDDRRVQEFVIHQLAKPYIPKRARMESIQVEEREAAIERGVVPAWARCVTVGCDVQGAENGIYWTALAWGLEGPRVHVVDWGFVPGRFEDVRPELDELVKKRWPQEGEREMLAGRWLLDSGDGLNTLAVYRYCLRWKGAVVRPVKGEAALSANLYVLPSKTAGDHGGKLIRANVVALKDFWASLMSRDAKGETAVSFAAGASGDETFVSHLMSEERRLSRSARGQMQVAWVPRAGSAGNHWWDALIYGLAGAADLKVLGSTQGASRGNKARPRVTGGGGDAFGRK